METNIDNVSIAESVFEAPSPDEVSARHTAMILKRLESYKKMGRINSDGLMDLDDDIDLGELGLTSLSQLGIRFGTVNGDFDCGGNMLTSLEGCPTKVMGDFDCGGNMLQTLDGCPELVGGNFYCRANPGKFTPKYVRSMSDIAGWVQSDFIIVDESVFAAQDYVGPVDKTERIKYLSTRLVDIIRNEDYKACHLIFNNGIEPDELRGHHGMTMLELAVLHIKHKMVRLLLDYGADPSIPLANLRLRLHYRRNNGEYLTNYETAMLKDIYVMLVDASAKRKLHESVFAPVDGNSPRLIQMNKAKKWFDAVKRFDTVEMKNMIENGEDVNILNINGESAFSLSIVRYHDPYTAMWLLNNGVDPFIIEYEKPMIDLIIYNYHIEPDKFMKKKWLEVLNAIEKKLSAVNESIFVTVAENDPRLDYSKWFGSYKIILIEEFRRQILDMLAAGYDIDKKDFDGRTLLVKLVYLKRFTRCAFMLDSGANPDIADNNGVTFRKAFNSLVDSEILSYGMQQALDSLNRADRRR